MKQLHFTTVGKMLVAFHGNYRLVIHPKVYLGRVGQYVAEVHAREGKKKAPLATQTFGNKAQAVDWLSRQAKERA